MREAAAVPPMSLLLIVLIIWVVVVAFALAALRAAALADRAAESHARRSATGPAVPAAGRPRATGSPDRTHGWLSPPKILLWLAAGAALTAAGMTVQRLGGVVALGVFTCGVCAGAGLLSAIVVARRRRAEIDRDARALESQRDALLILTLRVLTSRDPSAAQHAASVAHHARVLAAAVGLSPREQRIVHSAGLLHDIGLLSPVERTDGSRPLEDADRRAIGAHPLHGACLLETVPGFEEVAAVVAAHHERIDGTGYPRGLSGERIPLMARIVAIAEVYDVLTAPDSYRQGGSHDWAARELRRVAARQLDAQLVELFLNATSPAAHRRSLDDELIAARRMAAQVPAHSASARGRLMPDG